MTDDELDPFDECEECGAAIYDPACDFGFCARCEREMMTSDLGGDEG